MTGNESDDLKRGYQVAISPSYSGILARMPATFAIATLSVMQAPLAQRNRSAISGTPPRPVSMIACRSASA